MNRDFILTGWLGTRSESVHKNRAHQFDKVASMSFSIKAKSKWFIFISQWCSHLIKLLFSSSLQFKGDSVRGQTNSKYLDRAPFSPLRIVQLKSSQLYAVRNKSSKGSLHDLVKWYRINYAGTQIEQWDFRNKRKVGLDWYEFLCFGSPTVWLAFQHNLFRTMWSDGAMSLF